MHVKILKESGLEEALLGLSLSYNTTPSLQVAVRLASKDKGHNKFLESIVLWLDITAPRNWWSQFDTYRIGVTKQSESSMHTIMRRHLTQNDFEHSIYEPTLVQLNSYIDKKDFTRLKNELPEGFLQRRIVCLNYKVLRNIISQRLTHKLPGWTQLITSILTQSKNSDLLEDLLHD